MAISKEQKAFILLRLVIALIIATHGWHRLITGGYDPFGLWLESKGFPFGVALALGITLYEVIGSLFLAWSKQIAYLCLGYIAIYLTGLFMVHLPNGWFVVGSGTNGIEYSVLIISALICIGYPHLHNDRKITR